MIDQNILKLYKNCKKQSAWKQVQNIKEQSKSLFLYVICHYNHSMKLITKSPQIYQIMFQTYTNRSGEKAIIKPQLPRGMPLEITECTEEEEWEIQEISHQERQISRPQSGRAVFNFRCLQNGKQETHEQKTRRIMKKRTLLCLIEEQDKKDMMKYNSARLILYKEQADQIIKARQFQKKWLKQLEKKKSNGQECQEVIKAVKTCMENWDKQFKNVLNKIQDNQKIGPHYRQQQNESSDSSSESNSQSECSNLQVEVQKQ